MTTRTLAELEAARDTAQAAALDYAASHNPGAGGAERDRLQSLYADAVRELEAHPDFGTPPARPEAPRRKGAGK